MLNQEELRTLRDDLAQQLARLRHEIGEELTAEAGGRFRDLAGEVTDLGDEAVGAELAGTDNALIGRHVREVRDIEAAFARMDAGTYGRCVDCETDIDYARLAAYPTCKRCSPCQAVHEKTFAGQATPSL
jgi:RNA polymerase-binding transcription factor DksA